MEDSWENVLLPWFESMTSASIPNEAPIAVVTPFRSQAYFLRSKLLARGISLLGVRFLSPAQLRERLLRGSRLSVPLREHLRLLLAIAAEEIVSDLNPAEIDKQRQDRLIAKSVARDPDHFLRALDQLSAAGWSFDEMEEPALREIATRFDKSVRDCGFSFVHEADRAALTAAEKSPPRFSNLLVSGFDGAHWPLWPLLRAAVAASTEAVIILNDPRDEARDLDEVWIGTWEEAFGPAQPIEDAASNSVTHLHALSRLPETDSEKAERADNPIADIHFLVGRDTTQQARAIVALTAKFLGDERCERVGILFPRSGALARLVATVLESAKIAHNDGIAHLAPSVFDDDAWRAWLDLQQYPQLKFLFRFLRTTAAEIFGELSLFEVEDVLRRAYADVLIDKIDILREYCARDDRNAAIVHRLEAIQFLPGAAPLTEFLAQTQKIFAQLGWKEHWSEIDRLSRNWTGRLTASLSKNIYLRWLRELLSAPSLSRDDHGAHPYSRVHLLPYAQAEGQTWSHLIFAGLNEEAWPSLDDEFGFVRDQEIDELNRRNKILNRRAVKRGSQGEGQWSVGEGKTLFLGSTERRQIRRRQLRNLMESATIGVGVTANLYSESFPSRIANPSELFSRLYFSARGKGVSQKTLHGLEEQTRNWLKDWSPIDAQKVDSVSVGRTRLAYDARRQPRQGGAGEYEFALRGPPDRPIALRVTDWEQALRWPALTWMKIFLGTEAEMESGDAWAISTGQWVHRWLAESAGNGEGFVAISQTDKIRARILDNARQFRAQVQKLCTDCGVALPDWWTSGWSNALYIADCLAAKLSDLTDWSHMATEWRLGAPATIRLDTDETLRVRGRVDLILARGQRDESRLGYSDLWVVDYKTGKQRGFNLRELRKNESPEEKFRKQLVEGRGVQLALYALAVHAAGASNVQLTLLAPNGELEPQFHLQHALAQKDFWRELHHMQESGVFGMLGKVHNEFGVVRSYPLATLAVDPDLLREKWAITHPSLATEAEEGEA